MASQVPRLISKYVQTVWSTECMRQGDYTRAVSMCMCWLTFFGLTDQLVYKILTISYNNFLPFFGKEISWGVFVETLSCVCLETLSIHSFTSCDIHTSTPWKWNDLLAVCVWQRWRGMCVMCGEVHVYRSSVLNKQCIERVWFIPTFCIAHHLEVDF